MPRVPGSSARADLGFERGARRRGEAAPGVGLGLALSRGLARDMGGDLRLRPPVGGGACFELSLPIDL